MYYHSTSFFLRVQQTTDIADTVFILHMKPSMAIITIVMITILVFALLSVAIAVEHVDRPLDLAVLSIAFMIVVLQLVSVIIRYKTKLFGHQTERFIQDGSESSSYSTPYKFDGTENISAFPAGITLYLSCYDAKSYSDKFGKTWKNVAPPSSSSTSFAKSKQQQLQQQSERNFSFSSTPVFSRRDGYSLRDAFINGPYSVDIGIRGDAGYTIFFVAKGAHVNETKTTTEEAVDAEEGEGDENRNENVTIFKLYANTPGLNGVSLVASKPPSDLSENTVLEEVDTVKVNMTLLIGQTNAIRTEKPVKINPKHRYLFVVVKDLGSAKIIMFDVDSSDEPRSLLAENVLSQEADPVHFSNKDMTINETRNWDANILAFGTYERAISERETTTLFDHYKRIHREFDPAYLRLLEEVREKERAKECPFSTKTCAMCHAVKDWTDLQQIITADEDCKAAIAKFCAGNPSHEKCKCWNVNHPNYSTSCKTYRCAVGGSKTQPECAPPSSPPPPPPPPLIHPHSHLSPTQVKKAVTEALQQERMARLEEERRRPPPPPPHEEDETNNGGSDKSFWAWILGY